MRIRGRADWLFSLISHDPVTNNQVKKSRARRKSALKLPVTPWWIRSKNTSNRVVNSARKSREWPRKCHDSVYARPRFLINIHQSLTTILRNFSSRYSGIIKILFYYIKFSQSLSSINIERVFIQRVEDVLHILLHFNWWLWRCVREVWDLVIKSVKVVEIVYIEVHIIESSIFTLGWCTLTGLVHCYSIPESQRCSSDFWDVAHQFPLKIYRNIITWFLGWLFPLYHFISKVTSDNRFYFSFDERATFDKYNHVFSGQFWPYFVILAQKSIIMCQNSSNELQSDIDIPCTLATKK